MLSSLRALRDWYQDHGSNLVIQHGDPTDIVGRVAESIGAEQVVWNSDHSRLARERDRAVRRALTHSDIAHTSVPSKQAAGMRSATPPVSEPAAYLAPPDALDIETRSVPQLSELADTGYDTTPLTAGTEAARKRLQALSNGTTYRRCDDNSGFGSYRRQ
ncbi:MAG: deoxyribodipyrimidine photolyase [uncultured archaeon A07HN63]|nr:MAG: deoxyribodipyrimidine photolyase [uncultured archaeon A07HN63]